MKDVDNLYRERSYLLQKGYEWDSVEVLEIENKIDQVEILPSFEDVIEMISTGKMKSLFS